MRPALSLLLIGVLCRPVAASENAGKLDHLVKRYLDGLFRAKPHLATFMGDHRFDGALPRLERRRHQATRGRARRPEEGAGSDRRRRRPRRRRPRRRPDPRRRHRARAAVPAARSATGNGTRGCTTRSPITTRARSSVGGCRDIIHGDFAPEAERKGSVLAQLRALPGFLAGEEAALLHPHGKRRTPRIYAEQGIKANQGTIEFFETEVHAFVGDAPAYAAARRGARALPEVSRDRASATRGRRLAPRRRALRQEVPARAADQDDAGRAVARAPRPRSPRRVRSSTSCAASCTCSCGRRRRCPPPAPTPSATEQQKVIQRVVDEISKDHPKPDELVAAHARNLDALRAFIEKHDLLGAAAAGHPARRADARVQARRRRPPSTWRRACC